MGIVQNIKRLFSASPMIGATIDRIDGAGAYGAQHQPFNYRAAINMYASWIYAAARMNAVVKASVPLRIYTRAAPPSGKKWNFRTRAVSKSQTAYMRGDACVRPSRLVIQKVADLGSDFVEVTEDHPITRLINTGNDVYSGYELDVLRTTFLELTGNAYMHPVFSRDLGVPVEWWPLYSQHVHIVPDKSHRTLIDGYVYGRSLNDPDAVRFERDEVIHFRYPNPSDVYYGMGKAEAAWNVIAQNVAQHDMDLALFQNHARPDWLLIMKGVRRDEMETFEQRVENKLAGTRKRGRFLSINGDQVDAKPLSWQPDQMGDDEKIVEEIAAVFGVPVSLLKANDPNLASAVVGHSSYREHTILPLCRFDEEELNQSLLPLFGLSTEDVVLAYDNPVPSDREFEINRAERLKQANIASTNELREELGMEPMEGHDDLESKSDPFAGLFSSRPASGSTTNEDATGEQEAGVEVSTAERMSGIDAERASMLLEGVSSGEKSPQVVRELLIAMGIDHERAQLMVDAATEFKPKEPEPTTEPVTEDNATKSVCSCTKASQKAAWQVWRTGIQTVEKTQ